MNEIKQELGLNEVTTFKEIVAFCYQQKKHFLLLIDDAQYLSNQVLEEILQTLKQMKPNHVIFIFALHLTFLLARF